MYPLQGSVSAGSSQGQLYDEETGTNLGPNPQFTGNPIGGNSSMYQIVANPDNSEYDFGNNQYGLKAVNPISLGGYVTTQPVQGGGGQVGSPPLQGGVSYTPQQPQPQQPQQALIQAVGLQNPMTLANTPELAAPNVPAAPQFNFNAPYVPASQQITPTTPGLIASAQQSGGVQPYMPQNYYPGSGGAAATASPSPFQPINPGGGQPMQTMNDFPRGGAPVDTPVSLNDDGSPKSAADQAMQNYAQQNPGAYAGQSLGNPGSGGGGDMSYSDGANSPNGYNPAADQTGWNDAFPMSPVQQQEAAAQAAARGVPAGAKATLGRVLGGIAHQLGGSNQPIAFTQEQARQQAYAKYAPTLEQRQKDYEKQGDWTQKAQQQADTRAHYERMDQMNAEEKKATANLHSAQAQHYRDMQAFEQAQAKAKNAEAEYKTAQTEFQKAKTEFQKINNADAQKASLEGHSAVAAKFLEAQAKATNAQANLKNAGTNAINAASKARNSKAYVMNSLQNRLGANQKTFNELAKLRTDPNRASGIESDPALNAALTQMQKQAANRVSMGNSYDIIQQLRSQGQDDEMINRQLEAAHLPYTVDQIEDFVNGTDE
jgi:hypothetical protein